MFGHGFIIVNSQVVASVDESSQSPFSVDQEEALTSTCVLSDHKLSNYPLSCCVSPPVLPSCAIYACCHPSWAMTNAEQQLAETISTF